MEGSYTRDGDFYDAPFMSGTYSPITVSYKDESGKQKVKFNTTGSDTTIC